MVTVLIWALFLAVAEGYGIGGRGNCEHRGKQIPFGVVQTFDNCEYCVCTHGGNVQCQTFDTSDCSAFDTDCDAPFIPFGECCPRCHSETQPEFPHYSGYGNNVANPMSGSVGSKLIRLSPPRYGDGFATPRTHSSSAPNEALTNAREISTVLGDTDGNPELNADPPVAGPEERRGLTCWFWQWGQFIDHDFTLVTEVADTHAEEFGIHIPNGDVYLPDTTELHFARANWDRNTGTGPGNWRGHINSISTAIDASNVYGSDAYTNFLLRGGANSQDGKLIVGSKDAENGDLLPLNNGANGVGLNLATMGGDHFAAGDFRVNEQQLLTTMHTLWMREHNRWADVLKSRGNGWDDERLFQEARKRVIAEMQMITYDEWLPAVLGTTLQRYSGYQPNIPMAMSTEFVGSFFRFGHTAIRDTYQHIAAGYAYTASLRDLFFNAEPFLSGSSSVAGFARGLSQCRAQEIDTKVVDALRLHLFNGTGDLLAANIQRARDMGIGSINDVRRAMSLPPHTSWSDVTADTALQTQLAQVYARVDDCDSWICAMAEKKMYGSVGETLGVVLTDQFARLRDGDRFWWQNWLTEAEQADVGDFRLVDLLEENGVDGTKTKAGDKLRTLFLASDNDHFTAADIADVACTDMEPQNCGSQHTFSYPQDVLGNGDCKDASGAKSYQPCLCTVCAANDPGWNSGDACGSDGKTYGSICDIKEAACERTNLHFVHKGNCYDSDVRVTLEVGFGAHIRFPIYGVPPRLVADVDRLPGNNQKQRWEVHFVTNCATKERLNPTASPQAPIPSIMDTRRADCENSDCTIRGRIQLGTRVATEDVKFLQTMECDSASQIHVSGILGRSILIKPEGESDNHNKAQCHVVTGSPFVQLRARLRAAPGELPSVTVHLSGDINGDGAANVQVKLEHEIDQFGDTIDFPAGGYSFYLTNEGCSAAAWTHFNYGQDAHGETPPLLSLNLEDALLHEDTFLGVNPYLRIMGKNTPLKRRIRMISHVDSSVVACGRVTLIDELENSDCLLDNTANGGTGQSSYREFRNSGGFAVNLAESEQQAQGSTQNTNTNASGQTLTGGLTSGTGILMIMVALVVVLLLALIFVVIVLYVRSNPYTAPSALKKVGSLAGDPRPSAQVVN